MTASSSPAPVALTSPTHQAARAALETIAPGRRNTMMIIFTAHSIPLRMAETSDYEAQLKEASALVAKSLERDHWQLAYQSRSGAPGQPGLEPDVLDFELLGRA